MFPYIVCPSCGWVIGQVFLLFDVMRIKQQEKAMLDKGYDINTADQAMIQAIEGVSVDLKGILDVLNIKRECCRTKLLTQEQFYA